MTDKVRETLEECEAYEDARGQALNRWHETPEAKSLLGKIDAFERCSDHWIGECPQAATAFRDAAADHEAELDELRRCAVDAAADTYSNKRHTDEWLEAWDAADSDAPPVEQAIREARRAYALHDRQQRERPEGARLARIEGEER